MIRYRNWSKAFLLFFVPIGFAFGVLLFRNSVFTPYQIESQVSVKGDFIEVFADFSNVQDVSQVDLFLYTPNARYTVESTTSSQPNFGNDYKKGYLIDWLVQKEGKDSEFVKKYLSYGISHPSKATTVFKLNRKDADLNYGNYKVFIVQHEKRFLHDGWLIVEVPITVQKR